MAWAMTTQTTQQSEVFVQKIYVRSPRVVAKRDDVQERGFPSAHAARPTAFQAQTQCRIADGTLTSDTSQGRRADPGGAPNARLRVHICRCSLATN